MREQQRLPGPGALSTRGLPARLSIINSTPCERFLVLIPNALYDIFKFIRICKRIPISKPTTDASHLYTDGLYDRYRFLRSP